MYRKVHLLGELGVRFGTEWSMEATSLADIVRLIGCQEPEFKSFLVKSYEAGVDLAIVSAGEAVDSIDKLFLNNLGAEDVFLTLVPGGSSSAWTQIILGVILAFAIPGIGFAYGLWGATTVQILTSLGIALALGGITQLFVDTPETQNADKSSGAFSGPENTIKAGQPVPILYGELLVGGVPIHVDLKAGISEQLTYSVPWIGDYSNITATVVGRESEQLPELSWATILNGEIK